MILAVAYYMLVNEKLADKVPATLAGVTPAMLEDILDERVLASKEVSSEEMGKRINRIAMLGVAKLGIRVKKYGVPYAFMLWS